MFEIKVNRNIISVQETEPLTSGSVSVYQCHFSFDASWDGFFRSAVFRVGSMVKTIPLDNTDTCELPWELLDKKHIGLPVEVSVYGVKDETEIQPTIWDKLGRVRRGSEPGEDAKEFSPSVYDRIVSLVKLYSDKIKGDKGDKGDPGEGDMTAAVYDPQGKETDIYQYADNVLASVPEWAMQSVKPTYTAREVGAAPHGYGLGMMWNIITDFNDTSLQTGWYTAISADATINYPSKYFAFAYGIVRIERRGDNITQTAVYGPYSAVRLYNGSTWGEWNYVNPPMELGVEYRTTERYLGKPVYARAIDFGTLPTYAEVSKRTGIGYAAYNIERIVEWHGQIKTGDNTYPLPINFISHEDRSVMAFMSIDGLTLKVTGDWWETRDPAPITHFVIKYTKTTE